MKTILVVCCVWSVAAALPEWGYNTVQAFGAKADGTTDDTPAFAAALEAASGAGGVVFVPAGTYAVRGSLTVPAGVTLRGSNEYPFRSWGTATTVMGTTLLAFSSSAPFITLDGSNSGVQGLSVFYPEVSPNTAPPVVYPPCIMGGGGDDLTVKDVLLVNPYIGIDFSTHTSGRHFVSGVYGQPLSLGISVDQCYDIGRVKQIHFWPFWASLDTPITKWMHVNAVSLEFLRTDWEIVDDVFSFGYHVGMDFKQSANGSCNGQFSNINFDDVDVGVSVTDTQAPAVVFSNLNVANAGDGVYRIGIRGTAGGTGNIVIRGGSFWGDLNQAVVWDNAGYVSISDSMFHSWNSSQAAVSINSGRASLRGNYFHDVIGTAIAIGAGTDRVLATGNELIGNTLINNGKDTLVANNHA